MKSNSKAKPSEEDIHWMREALALARKGVGWTQPNPAVGAVIIKNGKLLGSGYHHRAGNPHAEIVAIRDVLKKGHSTKGATIYVTLEPCCTHGRTGPCTEAIKLHQFKRVVVGATDPNPHHAGRGYRILRKAGIQVTHGVLEKECKNLNRAFNHWIQTGKPWVIAKVAMTLDGYIALPKGKGRWITGEESREDVHRLRATCDAILVGAGTVRADDPQLNVRGVKCLRQPLRIIMSRSGKLPAKSKVRTDSLAEQTVIYRNASWSKVLSDLGKLNVSRLLVEGGEKIFNSLVKQKLINEVWVYFAPVYVDFKASVRMDLPRADSLTRVLLKDVELKKFGRDLRMTGIVSNT